MVLFVIVTVPESAPMPPPEPVEVFEAMVLFLTVSVPAGSARGVSRSPPRTAGRTAQARDASAGDLGRVAGDGAGRDRRRPAQVREAPAAGRGRVPGDGAVGDGQRAADEVRDAAAVPLGDVAADRHSLERQ